MTDETASVLDGRYRLDGVLGHGGMAVVYRATDLRLGRNVAVKMFREDFAEAVDLRRTQREVELLAGASSPHIVTVFDAAAPTTPGPKYLVMEFVDGTDLRHLLATRRPSPEFVRRIGADVAMALQVLHAKGIVHRDVKPGNVLVPRGANHRPHGVAAKLGDFGIAQMVDATRLTAANQVFGTPAYLSPEQLTGVKLRTASDIYSLGLVLIECLTGRTPFEGTLTESTAARLARGPQLPRNASPALAALLERMTALDPVERPTAKEVAAALNGPLTGQMTRPRALSTDGAADLSTAPSLLPGRQQATEEIPIAALHAERPELPSTASGVSDDATRRQPVASAKSHQPPPDHHIGSAPPARPVTGPSGARPRRRRSRAVLPLALAVATALAVVAVSTAFALGGREGTGSQNRPPTAAFTATASGLSASFDGTGSRDPDRDRLSYRWDFGDGSSAGSGSAPSHHYEAASRYSVTLTVSDGHRHTVAARHPVTVTIPPKGNRPPTAAFTSTSSGLSASFDGSGSRDPDRDRLSYSWDFGDGSSPGGGSTSSHDYKAGGSYSAVLTVSDGHGHTVAAHHPVTVVGQTSTGPTGTGAAPEGTNGPPTASFTSTGSGLTGFFDASKSRDPDGDSLAYGWDFGDGTALVSSSTTSHRYKAAGKFTVTLAVSDGNRRVGRATHTIAVSEGNRSPTAAFTWTSSGLKASFEGSGSRDPDGDRLSYAWDFGDGSASARGEGPSHNYAADGDYRVTLTVSDGHGHTGTTDHTVSVRNRPPNGAFTSTTSELAAEFDGSQSSDPDDDSLTYAWDFGDGSTGTRVTPSHSYARAGTYTVQLTVADGHGGSDQVRHDVTVNQTPTAAFSAVNTDLTVSVDGTASSDPDGHTLTYAWTFGDGTAGTGETASHTYESSDTYTVKLTVSDGHGGSDSVSHDVTVR